MIRCEHHLHVSCEDYRLRRHVVSWKIRSILWKGIASDGYMHKVVFTSEVCTLSCLVKVFVSKFRERVPCPMSALNTLLEAGEPGGHAETRLTRPSPQVCSGRTCNMCPPPLARPELLWLARLPASSGSPSTALLSAPSSLLAVYRPAVLSLPI